MTIRNREAFTFFEILMVLVILGVLVAMFYPVIQRQFLSAEKSTTKLKIAGVKNALIRFRGEFGRFPSTKEGLQALVRIPDPNNARFKQSADLWPFAKEEEISDRSGTEFTYHCPPERFKNKYQYFEIIYLGPAQNEDTPELEDGM